VYNETGNRQRIEYIDLLKAFTIFLVLWGHNIQQFDNSINLSQFYLIPASKIIYSFHMPLFFMLSGFFFKSSLKLRFKEYFIKKVQQLALPWLVWCILRGSYLLIDAIVIKGQRLSILQCGLKVFSGHFWFLIALFLLYTIVYIFYRFVKKVFLVFLLSLPVILFFPYGYHLPAFLFGILIKENYNFIKSNSTKLLIISSIAFIISEYFWQGSYQEIYLKFISWGRMQIILPNVSDIQIGLYHIFIGLIGSFFFFILFYKIYQNNKICIFLSSLGKYSLAIYVLQVIIIETILTKIINFEDINMWVYSIPVALIFAIFEMTICIGIIKLVQLNKKLEKYYLEVPIQIIVKNTPQNFA
jgi:fucose 4-O-acetylase-like acetyltransferase